MLSGIPDIGFEGTVTYSMHREGLHIMVEQWLICDILMTIVNQHSHDSSSMKKETLVDYADGGLDDDVLRDAIDEVVDMFPFLVEWSQYRETRIHLNQDTGEILHYLVEECDEEPPWLRPELNHVPREDWQIYGITW